MIFFLSNKRAFKTHPLNKFLVLLPFLLMTGSPLGQAEEGPLPPPINPPEGLYSYQGELLPLSLRVSKGFDHNDPEQKQVIKDLKTKGYLCFRRSQRETTCQIKYTQFNIPNETEKRIGEQLAPYNIDFNSPGSIEFSHNGSTTKEWLVYGEFKIGSQKIRVYRISRNSEGKVSLAFPADNGTPISFLNFYEDKIFGFSFLLQGKDTEGWTYTYLIDAIYQPKPDSRGKE